MAKNILKYLVICVGIPLVILAGFFIGDRYYAYVSIIAVILACVPFFISFEHTNHTTRYLVILALMTGLSVAGRFIFSPIPFFKPVTAIVIISAMYFGSEFGFMTGALSAVISNFYFGQGPWTPFQIFAWGIIGFIAGLLAKRLIESKVVLIIYGGLAGVLYSFIMDIWTTLWAESTFNISRFLTAIASASVVTLIYVVSNIIFLLALTPFLSKKIIRIKTKYGL